MQSILVFIDTTKVPDFSKMLNADVSKTQGVFHVNWIFFK